MMGYYYEKYGNASVGYLNRKRLSNGGVTEIARISRPLRTLCGRNRSREKFQERRSREHGRKGEKRLRSSVDKSATYSQDKGEGGGEEKNLEKSLFGQKQSLEWG